MAVLGLSPWVIPLIAAAARLTYGQTRNAGRSELPRPPSDREDAGREERARETLNVSINTNMAVK
jgi:hypothetical protein